jgi:hypothetical protein
MRTGKINNMKPITEGNFYWRIAVVMLPFRALAFVFNLKGAAVKCKHEKTEWYWLVQDVRIYKCLNCGLEECEDMWGDLKILKK